MRRYNRLLSAFHTLRDQAARTFPDVEIVEFRVIPHAALIRGNADQAERARAFCTYEPDVAIFCSSILDSEAEHRIQGVMRHEFGHAIEAVYGVATVRKFLRIKPAAPEHRADEIARIVFGRRIGYDDQAIQTINGGGLRPNYLPR
jgi:hypothetical protein